MKRLTLLRHGKSDWNANYDSDHDRPLSTRGEKAARAMGRVLGTTLQVPDLILSSTALRARTTAKLAMNAGGWNTKLQLDEALYMSSVSSVLKEIHRVDDSVHHLMVVGHEPTWSTLAAMLTGGSHIQMKTGTAVSIEFRVTSWRGVGAGRGELVWILQPRLFTDGEFDLV